MQRLRRAPVANKPDVERLVSLPRVGDKTSSRHYFHSYSTVRKLATTERPRATHNLLRFNSSTTLHGSDVITTLSVQALLRHRVDVYTGRNNTVGHATPINWPTNYALPRPSLPVSAADVVAMVTASAATNRRHTKPHRKAISAANDQQTTAP